MTTTLPKGLALAPWNVIAGGALRTDAEEQRRRQTGEKGRTFIRPNWERTDEEKKMSAALEKVAKEVGTEHITAVAIAYLLQRTPYVFPIFGARKIEHLMANVDALKISLSSEQIKYLESIIPFDPGFPSTFIVSANFRVLDSNSLLSIGKWDSWGWCVTVASGRNIRPPSPCATSSSAALKILFRKTLCALFEDSVKLRVRASPELILTLSISVDYEVR